MKTAEQIVRDAIAEMTGWDAEPDELLVSNSLDSLDIIEMATEIEIQVGIEFDEAVFDTWTTVSDVIAETERLMALPKGGNGR